jgi:predicted DNA-binding protein (UPF0251 family)
MGYIGLENWVNFSHNSTGGRPIAVTPDKIVRARQLIASGLNVREAAARMKISKSALYAALKNLTE